MSQPGGAQAVLQVALPPTAQTAATARREVRRRLEAWGLGELVETVVLLTSELVTNVLLHTGTEGRLELRRDGDGVRVTVLDGSPVLPITRRRSTSATTGRGCRLLDDLADDWGSERREGGKAVWFTATPGRDPWADLDVESLLAQADL